MHRYVKLCDRLGDLLQDRIPHTKYCFDSHIRYTVILNFLNNTIATMKAYNLRILLATGLFLFLFQPVLSEENIRYYDIELVVFESLEENTYNNENWPTAKQLEIPENAAILGNKFEGKLPPEYDPKLLFNSLSVEDYQLKEEVESIQESEQYRLLLHTGWRQPGLPKKQAVTVYFNHTIAEDDENTESEAVESSGDTATPSTEYESETESVARMEGLITIVLARYLHLNVEMLYKKEPRSEIVDMFDTSFLEERRNKDSVFYLKQNRRMRSKETHYIDHPKFSMLVRITPFEVAPKVIPEATTQPH